MEHEVKIPSLGESIVSGVITNWLVQSGDHVQEGTVLYELETDKITSEGLAEASGIIEILAEVDSEVSIGQVVARIKAGGKEQKAEDGVVENTDSQPTQKSKPTPPDSQTTKPAESKRSFPLPPCVQRLAAKTGVDPAKIEGTGKDGRVTKADLMAAAKDSESQTVPDPVPPSAAPEDEKPVEKTKPASPKRATEAPERTTRKRMTPIRRKIAERLVEVKNQSAILTTFNEADMSAVLQLRKDVQDEFVAAHGVKLGFMSLFVKAAVHALKAVPALNARIEEDTIVTHHYYDIGVAVGTDRGLVVPVLRNCDEMTLAEIEKQLIEYAQQAKTGKLPIEAMQGGVFTLSNGGIYGSLLSTPILNPPQSGILGMHTIQERPVALNGAVVIRPMMYLALSYDHRIVDGKEAVTFLIKIKQCIENPTRMFLGL